MRVPRNAVLAIALAAFVSLAGCQPADDAAPADTAPTDTAAPAEAAEELTDAERTEIAGAIEQRHQELLDAWAQQDAFDAWLAFYVDEGHPDLAGGAPLLTINDRSFDTRAELEAEFREALSDRTTQVTVTDEAVVVLSPDDAVHVADFTYTITRGGETSDQYDASATTVWTRVGDEWKIVHYHQSWPVEAGVGGRQAEEAA